MTAKLDENKDWLTDVVRRFGYQKPPVMNDKGTAQWGRRERAMAARTNA